MAGTLSLPNCLSNRNVSRETFPADMVNFLTGECVVRISYRARRCTVCCILCSISLSVSVLHIAYLSYPRKRVSTFCLLPSYLFRQRRLLNSKLKTLLSSMVWGLESCVWYLSSVLCLSAPRYKFKCFTWNFFQKSSVNVAENPAKTPTD
jgi:hypothetical protein